MQGNLVDEGKNLKILICASEYYPEGTGIANVAYNVVENLKKEKYQCIVCSPSGPDIKIGNSRLIKKFGIIGILFYWLMVSKYFKKNKFQGIVWFHNPLFIFKNPFEDIFVTIHSTYTGKLIQFKDGKKFSKMIIYNRVVAKIEKYCFKLLKKNTIFTVVSPELIKELEIFNINKKNIYYIPNGVNTKLFKPLENRREIRHKFNISDDSILFLSVGLLSEVKQPLKLIDLFSIISEKNKHVCLVIAGQGNLFRSVRKKIEAKKLTNIKLLGAVSYIDDLPLLYSSSDYFILISKYEGQPLTLLEAMASGLPCIVSNIPNLKFVEDAQCGLLIDLKNLEKSAEIITNYLSQDNSIGSLNARNYIMKKFDWEIIIKKYITLFNNLKLE